MKRADSKKQFKIKKEVVHAVICVCFSVMAVLFTVACHAQHSPEAEADIVSGTKATPSVQSQKPVTLSPMDTSNGASIADDSITITVVKECNQDSLNLLVRAAGGVDSEPVSPGSYIITFAESKDYSELSSIIEDLNSNPLVEKASFTFVD